MIGGYAKGVLMSVAASFAWGFSGVFVKLILNDGVGQATVMTIRTLAVSVMLFPWLVFTRGVSSMLVERRVLAYFALIGLVSFVCAAMMYLISCEYLTVAQAVILHYTAPMLSILGDLFITKERPTRLQFIAVFLIIIGLYVGFSDGGGLGPISWIGVFFGTISVIGSAAQNLLTRTYVKRGRVDPVVQLFWSNVFGFVMIAVGTTFTRGWGDVANITMHTVMLLVYPIFGCSLLGFGFLYCATRYIPATLISLICSLEVLITLAGIPLLLGSLPTVRETIGSAIVLAAVVMSTIRKK